MVCCSERGPEQECDARHCARPGLRSMCHVGGCGPEVSLMISCHAGLHALGGWQSDDLIAGCEAGPCKLWRSV